MTESLYFWYRCHGRPSKELPEFYRWLYGEEESPRKFVVSHHGEFQFPMRDNLGRLIKMETISADTFAGQVFAAPLPVARGRFLFGQPKRISEGTDL